MTHQRRPHVVAHLRALDEHFGTLEPSPAFEKRLHRRLQRATEQKSSSPPWISVWLRRYARPTLVAIAATAVFVVSVSENAPPDRAAIVTPYAPDAAVDPIQTPMGEHLEQAIPHRDETPQTPLTSFPESPVPAPQELRNEKRNGFPSPSDPEFVPEKSPVQRRNVGPTIVPNTPLDRTHQRSEPFGFWSPAPAFPIDSERPADGKSGEWNGNSSSSPKTSHTPPPQSSSVCLAQEQLKKQAILDCEEMGQFLTNIVYLDPCKDGLFHRAEHECGENPADEETCTTDTLTNGDFCVDPGEFKMLAHEQCKLAMKELVEFTYITDDCGWKTRKATYTCCPFPQDPQPPSPAPVCQTEVLGDGSTCKDLGAIKEDAFLLCQSLGQTLADIQPAGNCPGGQASIAKIMCCSN